MAIVICIYIYNLLYIEFKNISAIETTTQSVTESADHSTSFTVTSTSTDIPINTIVTSSVVLSIRSGSSSSSSSSSVITAPTSTSATLIINSPTLSTSQSDDNNSFSVGVTVAIVVLVVVVLIIITVVVIGIIVVWKRKKTKQQTKPEDVYYSTIDETTLPRSPTNKPESDYIEMNDGQDNKEPQYVDIPDSVHSTKQVAMQDNPAYYIPSDEMQDDSVISATPVMVTFIIFKE